MDGYLKDIMRAAKESRARWRLKKEKKNLEKQKLDSLKKSVPFDSDLAKAEEAADKKENRSLLICNCRTLAHYESPDVQKWKEIFNLISTNATFIDRTERLKSPFRFKVSDEMKLPSFVGKTPETYENICNARVRDLLDHQDKTGQPMVILYSGGIDSTLIMTSILKNVDKAELKDRFKILLNFHSIRENPHFYRKYIRNKFNFETTENFVQYFDYRHMMVDGEHNDQLFGSDICKLYYQSTSFSELLSPYAKEKLVSFFIKVRFEKAAAQLWADLLDDHVKSAPCEIRRMFDFFWWLNFIFKWQSVYYRILLRTNLGAVEFNTSFLKKHFFHFYNTPEFQHWAMVNPDKKIGTNWFSYKLEAKKVIFEYDKNQDYFDNKMKIGSLGNVFISKKTARGLTSDFDFLTKIQPQKFYVPDNDFNR